MRLRNQKFVKALSRGVHTLSARILVFSLIGVCNGACSFKFEITSQRTALENQVMGSYKEIDDDVVLMASVRGVGSGGETKKTEVSDLQLAAIRAKQNQEFNRDDLDELKTAQIIGEGNDGSVVLLPVDAGKKPDDPKLVVFARALIEEENRDRQNIWARIVQSNPNLSAKDMQEVRRTYARMQFDAGAVGHWFQDEKGKWAQKAPVKK